MIEETVSNRELLHRFDGVERRLDELSKAVVSLARVEERLVSQSAAFARIDVAISATNAVIHSLDDRLSVVERQNASAGTSLSWLERGVWMILMGAVAWVVGKLD